MKFFTRIKWKAAGFILKFADPVINVGMGKSKLKTRLSHSNVFCYAYFPMYDKALPRVAASLQKTDGYLSMIDVGANIGDTAALVCEALRGAKVLCVEGNEKILELLEHNARSIQHNSVEIEPLFCVDDAQNTGFAVDTHYGTARLVKSGASSVRADTLDNMIERHPEFKNANLLKIDTDGFEIAVFNGAGELLKKKPVLYFEFNPYDYEKAGQNTFSFIDFLVRGGYQKALFYTNDGIPLGIYALTDSAKMRELIKNLEETGKNGTVTYYYDLLVIPEEKTEKYLPILEDELKILQKGE